MKVILRSILTALIALPLIALGQSADVDLVYTPIPPCRLVDTRGGSAPIQGGPFAPFERRSFTPNGGCGVPLAGVTVLQLGITTNNLTPESGGYLSLLPPDTPVSTTTDIFNLGSSWSATTAKVQTGPAGQFDAFINTATAHLVVDVFGYFAVPRYPVPMVYDVNGKMVGRALGSTNVIINVDGLDVPLALDPNGGPQGVALVWSQDYSLYFEDQWCSGPSFIARGAVGQQRPTIVTKDNAGNDILLMGAAVPEEIHARSSSPRFGSCTWGVDVQLTAWRTQPPRPLAGYGKPPFYIK